MLDLDKIRALLASYRSGGKVGGVTFNAAKGHTLPTNTKEIHLDAPEIIESLLSELDRLTADAQRWAMIRDTVTRLDAVARPGLPMGDDDVEQVVLRVLERTARKPAPVAPQVVRLHQAYEGTAVCLHCGKPMPWPEMDRCPRDSGFPTAPPCAG